MSDATGEDGRHLSEVLDDNGVTWTRYDYGPGDVIYQRECPDCDRGLLLTPARFCAPCGGTGYLVGTPHIGRDDASVQGRSLP